MANINGNLNNSFRNFQNSQNFGQIKSKNENVNSKGNAVVSNSDSLTNKSLFYLDTDDRMSYDDLLKISDDDFVCNEKSSLFSSFTNSVVSFVQNKLKEDKTLQKDIDDFHAAWSRLNNSG